MRMPVMGASAVAIAVCAIGAGLARVVAIVTRVQMLAHRILLSLVVRAKAV